MMFRLWCSERERSIFFSAFQFPVVHLPEVQLSNLEGGIVFMYISLYYSHLITLAHCWTANRKILANARAIRAAEVSAEDLQNAELRALCCATYFSLVFQVALVSRVPRTTLCEFVCLSRYAKICAVFPGTEHSTSRQCQDRIFPATHLMFQPHARDPLQCDCRLHVT